MIVTQIHKKKFKYAYCKGPITPNPVRCGDERRRTVQCSAGPAATQHTGSDVKGP